MQRWCLSIALVAVLALTGCNNSKPGEQASQPGQQPTEAVPVEPPTDAYQAAVATVYFADSNVEHLEPVVVDIPSAEADPTILAEGAMQALLAGPTEEAHARVLPESLALRGVTVADGLATLDLSSALTDEFQGGSGVASLAIYSLVNTLCGIDGIERVKIVVEGQPVDDFAGVLSLTEPLEADLSLVGGKPL